VASSTVRTDAEDGGVICTSSSIERAGQTGRIDKPECPGALELVTGRLLSAYRTLTPDDDLYPDFVEAWRQQDDWDRNVHFAYWRLGLRTWPTADGQVDRQEARSLWVWSWRRAGASDDEIAAQLGVSHEALRRRGALARADVHQKPERGPWTRAPRIVAVELESPPHVLDTWRDPRLNYEPSEQVKRLQDEMTRVTFNGPPVRPPTWQ